jgi:two-component system chemotaxis sensor kinase CheA
MDLSQYSEIFLAESKEHLGAINGHLLEWELNREASEPVGAIFRAMHTVKGMAATMGYQSVADLAHRSENLLDAIRAGGEAPGDDTLELLFSVADALEKTIDAAVAGRGDVDVDVAALLAALDDVSGRLQPDTESKAEVPRTPRASVPAPSGPGCWVNVTLDPDCALKGARALIILNRMSAVGEVHAVQPAAAMLEAESFDGWFGFRIETSVGEEVIEKEVRAAGDVEDVSVGAAIAAPHAGAVEPGRARHIRVDLRRLDALMDNIGELVTARDRLTKLSRTRADSELDDVSAKLSTLTGTLQAEIVQARMTPVWQVFDRFPRMVRDLARKLGKQVDFEIEGKDIELDRAILDEIGDPLVHLLRNAVDHGIETPEVRERAGKPPRARIVLSALAQRATVAIRVSDDGRGIDRAKILKSAKQVGLADEDVEVLTDEMLMRVLSRPGFSTARTVTDVSGRGVGIDVVATQLRALGGGLEVRSEHGKGTTFTLRLPVTLAIVRALTAKVGEERYVMPITHVAETLDLEPSAVTELEGQDGMTIRDDIIPLVHLRDIVDASGEPPQCRPVIVLQIGERRSGLVVDALAGQQEIVVKSFDPPQGTLPIFSGATVLGDGEPALILDAGGFL